MNPQWTHVHILQCHPCPSCPKKRCIIPFYLAMTSFKGPPFLLILNVVACILQIRFLWIIFWLWMTLFAVPVSAGTEFHFRPLDPFRPCRHPFRDDPETSALLADFVLVGRPQPTYQGGVGLLYNASVHVLQVSKRPEFSIFPVRTNYPILAGPFSRRPDFGHCWINIQYNTRYIFFIDRPNWAGFFRISQLPLLYTVNRWRRLQNILSKGCELYFHSVQLMLFDDKLSAVDYRKLCNSNCPK